jgi:hypothetical protein
VSAELPFADFLDVLRTRDIAIGVDSYLRVARLLARWDRTDRASFRTAIAAVLARNSDEVTIIRTAFDEIYPIDEAIAEPPPAVTAPTAPLTLKQWLYLHRWWIALGTTIAILIALSIRFAIVVTPKPTQTSTAGVTFRLPDSVDSRRSPPRPAPPLPRSIDWTRSVQVTALVYAIAFCGLLAHRFRRSLRSMARAGWQYALAAMPGPFNFSWSVAGRLRWFTRHDLEDIATILGRRSGEARDTRNLDVRETLRKTLRRGMFPELVFLRSRQTSPIVVIEDVAYEMRPWQLKVEELLSGLQRLGIRLERWSFDADAGRLSAAQVEASISLEALARRRPDSPLIVVSTGSGIASALDQAGRSWIGDLEFWPYRQWVNPIGNPAYWREELARLPLSVWPMTAEGLQELARQIDVASADRSANLEREQWRFRPITSNDLERLKRLIALVPFPPVALAELLRQRFCPDVPEEALLHIRRESEDPRGEYIRLLPAELARLTQSQRYEATGREALIRRFLLDVLKHSEPAPGSAAHLRWQLNHAVQRLQLADVEESDAEPALAALRALSSTPINAEVQQALDRAVQSKRIRDGVRPVRKQAARTLRRVPAVAATANLETHRRRMSVPAAILIPAGLTAIVLLVLAATPSLKGAETSLELKAYNLQHVPGANPPGILRMSAVARDGPAPQTPELFQALAGSDSWTRVDPQPRIEIFPERPFELSLVPSDQGRYYQLRATWPQRNLAISNAEWVPSRDAILTILAVPWATVRIRSGTTEVRTESNQTPMWVALAPGRYDIDFTGPQGRTTTESVELQPYATHDVVGRFREPDDIVRELLGSSPRLAR